MKNVFTFLRSYWSLFVGLLVVFVVVGGCVHLVRSCSQSVGRISENISFKDAQTNIETVNKLLDKIETLEKKDSIIAEKIKEIDSLRVELGGVTTDVDELARYLSNRYNKAIPKR